MGSTVRFNVKKCVGWALIVSTVLPILGLLVWMVGWLQSLLAICSIAIVLVLMIAFLIGLNLVC